MLRSLLTLLCVVCYGVFLLNMSYIVYKQSVKNITLSNLVSCLSSYKLCPRLADQFAGGCIEHTDPRMFTLIKTPSPFFKPNTIVLQVVKY